MSNLEFSLATKEDDPQLCALMNKVSMPGRLAVSFRREPSYFVGTTVQGSSSQVVVARDRKRAAIIGLGTKAERLTYVNGAARSCGYLCDLRIADDYRGKFVLARGFRFFRKLEERNPGQFHLTVIYGDNLTALRSLVGARAGLPHYKDCGRVKTPAIFLDRDKRPIALAGVSLARAQSHEFAEILEFINEQLRLKQFAPVLAAADFSERFPGLSPEDFYVARRENKIVGALAAWDQSAFRQVHVERYPPLLRVARPVYNLLVPLLGLRPLPPCGGKLPFFYLSFVAIQDNDTTIFRALLRFVYRDRRQGPWSFCIAGIHERDPLAAVLHEYRRIDAYGHLFVSYFPDAEASVRCIDQRIPYFEMAQA